MQLYINCTYSNCNFFFRFLFLLYFFVDFETSSLSLSQSLTLRSSHQLYKIPYFMHGTYLKLFHTYSAFNVQSVKIYMCFLSGKWFVALIQFVLHAIEVIRKMVTKTCSFSFTRSNRICIKCARSRVLERSSVR